VSGGAPGVIWLGSDAVTTTTLLDYRDTMTTWKDALSAHAAIHLLGCNVAATLQGRQFVDAIGTLLGANIAASTDETSALDWDLEYRFGHLTTGVPLDFNKLMTYAGSLDTVVDVAFTAMTLSTPTLVSGSGYTLGTVYKYTAITIRNGISVDAVYTITGVQGISAYTADSNVHSTWFEPLQTYSAPGYIEYTFAFYITGTNTKVFINNFYVTAMDIDGSTAGREYTDVGGFSSYCVDKTTEITLQQGTSGRVRFLGKTSDAPGNFENTACFIAGFTTPVTTMSLRIGYTGSSGGRQSAITWGAAAGTFSNPVCTVAPTVNSLVSHVATPMVTGTLGRTFATGDVFTVTVNGTRYTNGDGYLSIVGGTTWSLQISTPLLNGTYDVQANYTRAYLSTADQTTNELTVQIIPQPSPSLTISPSVTPSSTPSLTAYTHLSCNRFNVCVTLYYTNSKRLQYP
jgi:hypothetical protein